MQHLDNLNIGVVATSSNNHIKHMIMPVAAIISQV